MTEIKVEEWLGHEIRFVKVEDEWHAVAKDVTDALDIGAASNALRHMDDRYKGMSEIHTPGGKQKVITLTEIGTYRLIMRSNKKEAEEFQDWVFDTIKSLRQAVELEQYQLFDMTRKENMKLATDVLKNGIDNAEPKHYAKAHTIANKAVSNMYGFDKLVQVKDMTPDMLRDRQNIYEAVIEVMIANDRYNLGLSVSKTIYEKFGV